MQLLKTVILSFFTLLSVFNTQPSSQKDTGKAVLGESTGQTSSHEYALKEALGCDSQTSCRELCSKPENIQRCLAVYNSLNADLEPNRPAGSSSSRAEMRFAQPATSPAPLPTLTAGQDKQLRFLREIKTNLGCDYATTCGGFCSKTENRERCAEVITRFYNSILLSDSSSEPEAFTAAPSAGTVSPTPYLRYQGTGLNSDAVSGIKADFQQAYQKIMAAGGADREARLKSLQKEYLAVMSQGKDQSKASAAAILRRMEEAKSTEASHAAQFRERLQQIKNAAKKQIVETIDTKIGAINNKAVTAMNAALEKLNTLLSNINQRLLAMPSDTPDLAAVETEALDAQSAITDAQTAVLAQSAKIYPLFFSSDEAKLKGSIAPVVAQLTADIQKTHQTVVKARDAVVKVYKDAYRINSGTAASSSMSEK